MSVKMKCIAHISDLHFGRLDAPVAEGLVAELFRVQPTLLVISGDLTQRAGVHQYRAAVQYLRRLPTPQLVVPGNHDVPAWNILRRIFSPSSRFQTLVNPELNPVWRDDTLIVAGVNTARGLTRTSGWISGKQMESVCQTFAQAGPAVHKILVTHHPFVPAPGHPKGDILIGAGAALATLERVGVDLILSGHLHLAYHDDVRAFHRTANHSVLSIQAGTATSTRRRGEPNAYNLISFDGPDVDISVRSWNGAKFEPIGGKRYRRVDGIWERRST